MYGLESLYKTFQPAVHPVAGHCCYLFGVCLVEWVGLSPDNMSRDYLEVSVRSHAGSNIHEYGTA